MKLFWNYWLPQCVKLRTQRDFWLTGELFASDLKVWITFKKKINPSFSYPREQAQGAEFEKIIAPVDLILYFDCSNVSLRKEKFSIWPWWNFKASEFYFVIQETLVTRILKRAATCTELRADDNEETLKTRIATFRENTEKILVQYPCKLKRLNAERDVEPIFAEVVDAIDETLVQKSA